MSKGKKLKRIVESVYGGSKKESADLVVGKVISNARGFGFVSVDDMDEDIFIPEEYVHGAYHSDTVEVELLKEQTGRRKEGRIRNILVRGIEEIVGTYQAEKNFGFVISDNVELESLTDDNDAVFGIFISSKEKYLVNKAIDVLNAKIGEMDEYQTKYYDNIC